MKFFCTLALTVFAGGALSAMTTDPVASTAQATSVTQTHGQVSRPEQVCSQELYVMGAPGTHFKVFVDYPETDRTEHIYTGLIPPGGLFAASSQSAGCPFEQRHYRGIVRSVARAEVTVLLELE